MKDQDLDLRKEIEAYYLPEQLITDILATGKIPTRSTEALVGIGFADIADYTWLSKFLSPSENQAVLDGIYAAFNIVLKKRRAYLNKIEGDSIMFHFGGPIDTHVRDLPEDRQAVVIARDLFHTCVELQRVCVLFNEANESFLRMANDWESVEAMKRAFSIIQALRTNALISQAINALYQIKVRVGAAIGVVTIGNFGPQGAKHWDVIGVPVIQAKRMESTAPIGGLRITKELYSILAQNGTTNSYYRLFRDEAEHHQGMYRDISPDELFKYSKVILEEKSGAEFETYSVQVDPLLPERIVRQAKLLLEKGTDGIERIITFLQYYRGNRFVIDALEKLFASKEITLDKVKLLKMLDSRKYKEICALEANNEAKIAFHVEREYSYYKLLCRLSTIQDLVKCDPSIMPKSTPFSGQSTYLDSILTASRKAFSVKSSYIRRRAWFYNFLYPMTYTFFRSAMLDYQTRVQELVE
jgi:class 3 adenylate cyclase